MGWNAQEPHKHTSYLPQYFGEDELTSNYCRNPSAPDVTARKAPWCYTMSPDVVWEYCDVCSFNESLWQPAAEPPKHEDHRHDTPMWVGYLALILVLVLGFCLLAPFACGPICAKCKGCAGLLAAAAPRRPDHHAHFREKLANGGVGGVGGGGGRGGRGHVATPQMFNTPLSLNTSSTNATPFSNLDWHAQQQHQLQAVRPASQPTPPYATNVGTESLLTHQQPPGVAEMQDI